MVLQFNQILKDFEITSTKRFLHSIRIDGSLIKKCFKNWNKHFFKNSNNWTTILGMIYLAGLSIVSKWVWGGYMSSSLNSLLLPNWSLFFFCHCSTLLWSHREWNGGNWILVDLIITYICSIFVGLIEVVEIVSTTCPHYYTPPIFFPFHSIIRWGAHWGIIASYLAHDSHDWSLHCKNYNH